MNSKKADIYIKLALSCVFLLIITKSCRSYKILYLIQKYVWVLGTYIILSTCKGNLSCTESS